MSNFCHLTFSEHKFEGHFSFWREIHLAALENSGEVFRFDFNTNFTESLFNFRNFCEVNRIDVVFVEWFHDLDVASLIEFDIMISESGMKWVAQADVSTYLRDSQHLFSKSIKMNSLSHAKFCKSLVSLIVWDTHLVSRFGFLDQIKLYGVRDFQNTVSQNHVSAVRVARKESPKIGLVGQLYDYRGSERLIAWSRLNPKLEFKLAGQAKDTAKKLCGTKNSFNKKNLYILDEFFETDDELNLAISKLDYLFIDSERYPVPSGIALRARSLGIPVLISGGDSFYSDEALIDRGILTIPKNILSKPSLLTSWVLNLDLKLEKSNIISPDRPAVVAEYSSIFGTL